MCPVSESDLLDQFDFVRSVAGALVKDPSTADDLTQATMVRALESPPAEVGSIKGWLATVTRHLWISERRSSERRFRREKSVARSESMSQDRAHLGQEIVSAVAGLQEPYLSVVVMKYYEGRSIREIAHRTRASEATVRSRLSRAMARLRDRLDNRFESRRQWMILAVGLAKRSAIGPMKVLAGMVVATSLFWGGSRLVQDLDQENDTSDQAITANEVASGNLGDVSGSASSEPEASSLDRESTETLKRTTIEPLAEELVERHSHSSRVRVQIVTEDQSPRPGAPLQVIRGLADQEAFEEGRSVETLFADGGGWVEIDNVDSLISLQSNSRAYRSLGFVFSPILIDRDIEDLQVLTYEKRQFLHGRVVDATGRPAAGATVILRVGFADDWETSASSTYPFLSHESYEIVETCDSNGSFELRGIPEVACQIYAKGVEVGTSPTRFVAFEPTPLELRLDEDVPHDGPEPKVIARGFVVDQNGQPVEDARVFKGSEETAHVDAGGRFEIKGWTGEPYPADLSICARGFARQVLELEQVGWVQRGDPVERPVIVLEKGATLHIAGIDETGESVGASLVLIAQGYWAYQSAKEGRATFEFLSPGSYILQGTARVNDENVTTTSSIEVEEGSHHHRLEFRREPPPVSGVSFIIQGVDGRSGQMVAGIEAVAFLRTQPGSSFGLATWPRDDHKILAPNGIPGTYQIKIDAEGYAPWVSDPCDYDKGLHEIIAPLIPARTLSLRVLDAEGESVPDAFAIMRDSNGAPLPFSSGFGETTDQVNADSQGRLTFHRAPGSRVAVEVWPGIAGRTRSSPLPISLEVDLTQGPVERTVRFPYVLGSPSKVFVWVDLSFEKTPANGFRFDVEAFDELERMVGKTQITKRDGGWEVGATNDLVERAHLEWSLPRGRLRVRARREESILFDEWIEVSEESWSQSLVVPASAIR